MRTFKRERGFFTFAQNGAVDYVRLAYGLALSLRASQRHVPYLSIGVTPGTVVPDKYREVFDEVIEIPWGDAAKEHEWKLHNEWKAIHMTPYRETIKLDADMLFPASIDHWWDHLDLHEVWAATSVLTYRGDVATGDFYRKTFTANGLPNVYSAFLYFKHTDFAYRLFGTMAQVFQHYDAFAATMLDETRPKEASTDVVLAMAMQVLDAAEACTRPGNFPTFVHMKSRLQDWRGEVSENWLNHLPAYLTRDLRLKLGAYRQWYPVHYHIKDFLTDDFLLTYEDHLELER